jgi:hypothetical protein
MTHFSPVRSSQPRKGEGDRRTVAVILMTVNVKAVSATHESPLLLAGDGLGSGKRS